MDGSSADDFTAALSSRRSRRNPGVAIVMKSDVAEIRDDGQGEGPKSQILLVSLPQLSHLVLSLELREGVRAS
jgi:hypothetical protein